ncbi:hypothetical protein ACFQ51_40560 [Streptomyces kaempferi]
MVLALAQPDLPRQRAAYWACGVGVLVCWPSGALVGALAATSFTTPTRWGWTPCSPR